MTNNYHLILCIFLLAFACYSPSKKSDLLSQEPSIIKDSLFIYRPYQPNKTDEQLSRSEYKEKLYGFWLGQCIANWTGLVTEMDKIGNIGEIKTGPFYTREDWGKPDQPNIWSEGMPSTISPTIDFVFVDEGEMWGADDDTDIEYMYQYLLYKNSTSILNGQQIREGWLQHIREEEENFLWVSNQKAFDLMKLGMLPPATGKPENNPESEMIDAQLTTEIFGLFAPLRPDIALQMSYLPIRTTAGGDAARIAEFYVTMHSLATKADLQLSMEEKIIWLAEQAKTVFPEDSYPYKMYLFVKSQFDQDIPWEKTRDSLYIKYQVNQEDGYDITSKKLPCNGCFAAGINFGASLISLFYGKGDIVETIKIGALTGWDSDNPTATWGGLLGFMIGKKGIENAFGRTFPDKFHIHRTRIGFPEEGIDTFDKMAEKGIYIIDRVVQEELKGGINLEKDVWYIPQS